MEIMTTLENAFNPELEGKFVRVSLQKDDDEILQEEIGRVVDVKYSAIRILAMPPAGANYGPLSRPELHWFDLHRGALDDGWKIEILTTPEPPKATVPISDHINMRLGKLLLQHREGLLSSKRKSYWDSIISYLEFTLPGQELIEELNRVGYTPTRSERLEEIGFEFIEFARAIRQNHPEDFRTLWTVLRKFTGGSSLTAAIEDENVR